jgi:hypothetical protein
MAVGSGWQEPLFGPIVDLISLFLWEWVTRLYRKHTQEPGGWSTLLHEIGSPNVSKNQTLGASPTKFLYFFIFHFFIFFPPSFNRVTPSATAVSA